MAGYLVLARCGIDDIPCGLFDLEGDAVRQCATITRTEVYHIASSALALDTSEIYRIDVLLMHEKALPVRMWARDLHGYEWANNAVRYVGPDRSKPPLPPLTVVAVPT